MKRVNHITNKLLHFLTSLLQTSNKQKIIFGVTALFFMMIGTGTGFVLNSHDQTSRSVTNETDDKTIVSSIQPSGEVAGLKITIIPSIAPTLKKYISPTLTIITPIMTVIPTQLPTQQPLPTSQEIQTSTNSTTATCPPAYYSCSIDCNNQYIVQIKENDNIRSRLGTSVNPLEIDQITRKNSEDAKQKQVVCEAHCKSLCSN